MSKITITVTGDTGTGTTHIAALVTWALLKMNSRPTYNGPERGSWQQLAFDEHTLEKELAAFLNKGLLVDIVEVQTQPLPPPPVADPPEVQLEKMRAEMEAMKKLLDAKSDKLTDIESLEDKDNQKL